MMKQPDLGNKITFLRKQNGMTQSELASQCKITLRTIQRIEAGEVSPRFFTLKRLMEILEIDLMNNTGLENINTLNMNNTDTKSMFAFGNTQSVFLIAMVCGVINLFFAFAEGMLEPSRVFNLPNTSVMTFILVYFFSLVTYNIYLYGLLQIGKMNQNILLIISCISMMVVMVIIKSYEITSSIDYSNNSLLINSLKNIIFGVIFMMLGISMFLLSNKFGTIALVAGILECMLALFAIFSVPVPVVVILINLIGCRTAELFLFYKAYAGLNKDNLQVTA